jgi:hypothetical protein
MEGVLCLQNHHYLYLVKKIFLGKRAFGCINGGNKYRILTFLFLDGFLILSHFA